MKREDYHRLNDSCALFLADCMDASSASLTKDLAVLNRQWTTAESKVAKIYLQIYSSGLICLDAVCVSLLFLGLFCLF